VRQGTRAEATAEAGRGGAGCAVELKGAFI
jgi:hypothetical protein